MFNQESKRSQKQSNSISSKKSFDSKRKLFLENLEDRRLLTVGPQLIGIQPNDGELISLNADNPQIRESAPRDLTFRFDENQTFAPGQLDGIQITRANLDGEFSAASVTTDFSTGGLVEVQFTAAKLGIEQNGIQLVFSRRDQGGAGFPEIGVVENRIEVSLNTNLNNHTTAEQLIQALEENAEAYALIRPSVFSGDAGTDITNADTTTYSPLFTEGANDVVINPGYVGVGDYSNEIIVRFAETLPDDLYQIDVYGDGQNALRNSLGIAVNDLTLNDGDNGSDLSTQFELDLGAQIISVVPQPMTRAVDGTLTQNEDQILLFFNDDDLDQATAENTNFYQLIRTNDTTESDDDVVFNPVTAQYNAETDAVLLTFAASLDQLGASDSGAFRLRVGTQEDLPDAAEALDLIDPLDDAADNFDNARVIPAVDLESGGILISGVISENQEFPIDLPGDSTEPGHREINLEAHNHVPHASADSSLGIETIEYCFQDNLGVVSNDTGDGQPAYNNITEVQKQRAREILEQISNRTGTQFIETAADGFIIATGDLEILGEVSAPLGTLGIAGSVSIDGVARELVLMDDAEEWSDEFGGTWYQVAMHEIGHQLGLTHAYDLPANTILGQVSGIYDPEPYGPAQVEEDFPGEHDLVHLNHLHRPESRDIDLYSFELTQSGLFVAETMAERLRDFNDENLVLNSAIRLFQKVGDEFTLVAQNDDYFSNDSYIEIHLEQGEYFVGVSSSGNTSYDPVIPNSGFYGISAGDYRLKMNFRPDIDFDPNNEVVLIDADNPVDANHPEIQPTVFDGDADGLPGGVFDFWFRAAAQTTGVATPGLARTVFVDKSADNGGNGTLASPFNNLLDALNVSPTGIPLSNANSASVQEGDILRIVGNAGSDGDIRTELDNLAYEIGYDSMGNSLDDGAVFKIPKGVLVQVDSGVIMKMRRSWIGVGSTAPGDELDRSGGALQILGAPNLIDSLGNLVPEDPASYNTTDGNGNYVVTPLRNLADDGNEKAVVHITSYDDETIGLDTFTFSTEAASGDWGGILINHGIDEADQTRFDYAKKGIFLNHINHADIRYGGGQVVLDSVAQSIAPIQLVDARPTISNNEISFSRSAAIGASPDSFKESNFHSPEYQEEFTTNPFTVDYKRIGPDIHGNTIHSNTTNGLAIRVSTLSGQETQKLTVSGRLDDVDITHVLQENLVIQSTPGGPIKETESLSLEMVTLSGETGGSLAPGEYSYRMVLVDRNGNESLATGETDSLVLAAPDNAIELNQLLPATGDFVARRLYRFDPTEIDLETGLPGAFVLIATINQTDTQYLDNGTSLGGQLDDAATKLRPRFDARLSIDPALVLKLDGSHIQTEVGAQFIAEGRDGHEVIITSILDDRFGAGGTFDASGDGAPGTTETNSPAPGSWGGIYAKPESSISIDNAIVAYGGGVTPVEGSFTGFNAIEVHQAKARLANSVFEFNASGFGGQAPSSRFGRGSNEEAVVFVRSAQPVIVGNTFRNNNDLSASTRISAISINANSLSHELMFDYGRATGELGALGGYRDNHGPLVVGNRLSNNEINGMVIRGEVLTTNSIWDDTDITNVLFDTVIVPDFHTYGGLRLQSNPSQSLVVKLEGANAGFDVTGRPLETDDRIGGIIQILGQPKSPVVLTSLRDDTVGAGIQPNGDPSTDTNNDGLNDPADFVGQSTTQININFGPLMGANASAMQTARRAAEFWEGVLQDDVQVVIDAEFDAAIPGAGQMSWIPQPVPYDQARAAMIQDAGPSEGYLNQLPLFSELVVDGAEPSTDLFLTTANMKALGLSGFNLQPSAFGGPDIDGAMTISTSFNNSEADFFNVAIHEIGHALGFTSGILDQGLANGIVNLTPMDLFRLAPGQGRADFTDAARVVDRTKFHVFYDGGYYNPSEITTIPNLALGDIPLEEGVAVPNTDGLSCVDDTIYCQASHFKHRLDINNQFLGVMDPILNPNAAPGATDQDKAVLDRIGWDVVAAGPAAPGDWNTVLIDQFAHDRNVSVVVEAEARDTNAPGPNARGSNAQLLGELAPNQKAGDDNQRLGFEVSGFLTNADDVDVYSFTAEAGTQIYIDVDKTTHALDAVLELVDADNNVLARSVNSLEETATGSLPFVAPSLVDPVMGPQARVLHQSANPFVSKDYWAINPRDPGMRVELPGPVGTRNTYHVRIRSNDGSNLTPDTLNLDPENFVNPGLTSGAYSMQIRLEELDEVAGSTVTYASIGYASTGITVVGQPAHSFLAGETTEVETTHLQNDSLASAQDIGNVMQSERGTISVSGYMHPNLTALSTDWDEDFYRFEVESQELGPNDEITAWPMIFDLDWADGLGRANLNLGIYDEAGTLIYWGNDSNVADDRPRPNDDNQVSDLSRGSVGTDDPYIGPISLLPGTYFAVVSVEGHEPNFGTTTQFEPINSIIRVAEDHLETASGLSDEIIIEGSATDTFAGSIRGYVDLDGNFHLAGRGTGAGIDNSADPFQSNSQDGIPDFEDQLAGADVFTIPPIGVDCAVDYSLDVVDLRAYAACGLPIPEARTLEQAEQPILWNEESVVPWNLNDVSLFVAGPNNMSVFDPFTGLREDVDGIFRGANDEPILIGDVARQNDGTIHSISHAISQIQVLDCGVADANVKLLDIDPVTGLVIAEQATNIQTFELNDDGTAFERANECDDTQIGFGFDVDAMYFGRIPVSPNNTQERLIVVGHRNDTGPQDSDNGVAWKTNIVLELDPDTGQVQYTGNKSNPDRGPNDFEASLNAWSLGRIETGPELTPVSFFNPLGRATTITPQTATTSVTTRILNDGDFFEIDDGFQTKVFELNFGPEVTQNLIEDGEPFDPSRSPRDGHFWVLDTDATALDDEQIFQVDTGGVIVFANMPIEDGVVVTVTDNQFPAESVSFEFDSDDPAALTLPGATRIQFGIGDNADSLADKLKDAINAVGALDIVATQVGPRVSLTNDVSIALTLNGATYSGTAVRKEGAQGNNPIIQVKDPALLVDGDTFTVTNNAGVSETWELNDTDNPGAPVVTAGNHQIDFTSTMLAGDLAIDLAAAVDAVDGFTAIRGNARVAIVGSVDNLSGFTTASSNALEVETEVFAVAVEETFNRDEMGDVVETVFLNQPAIIAGWHGDRINFLGAETGDFSGMQNRWIDHNTSGISNSQHIQVGLLAQDQAAGYVDDVQEDPGVNRQGIASKIAQAINDAYPNQTVTASATGGNVTVRNGLITVGTGVQLNAGGQGPGGEITGLTAIKTNNGLTQEFFAVSDLGGLYSVDISIPNSPPNGLPTVNSTWIPSSRNDLEGIRFTGLTVGPQNVEGERYADMLFGIDEQGIVYAFNTEGVLQPVFNGGESTLQLTDELGFFDAGQNSVGLFFGNLDANLFWNDYSQDDYTDSPFSPQNENDTFNTQLDVYSEPADSWDSVHLAGVNQGNAIAIDKRQHDQGHGIPPSPDGTRTEFLPGHSSLHFGRGHVAGDARSYDYHGGAYGTVISNEFSLAGKSYADQPKLYFNFFKEGEVTNSGTSRDHAIMSISDNGGAWVPIADSRLNPASDQALPNTGGIWDQRHIDLSGFAGAEHLRLRIDYTSGAASEGVELRAIDGQYLRDGESFAIGNQVFEFELGVTFVLPSGGSIDNNSVIAIEDQGGTLTSFEFVQTFGTAAPGNIEVVYQTNDSPAEIAEAFAAQLTNAGYEIHLNNERLNLPVSNTGAGPVLVTPDTFWETFLEGQPGLNIDPATGLVINDNAVLVFVNEGMDRLDVADAMNTSMETGLYNPVIIPDSGASFNDGELFTISDGVSDPTSGLLSRRTFEFDSGLLIDIPNLGGQAISLGDEITFRDMLTSTEVTFEFVQTVGTAAPGNIEVVYQTNDLMSVVANALANEIDNNASIPLEAELIDGNRVQVHAADMVVISASNFTFDLNSSPGVGQDIEILADVASINDGDTITLTRPATLALPASTVVFEFDTDNSFLPNERVDIASAVTQQDIADALRDAINNSALGNIATSTGHFVEYDTNGGLEANTTIPGVVVRDREVIRFVPGPSMSAADMADVLETAIDNTALDISASVNDAQRRVVLEHNSLLPTAITVNENITGLELEVSPAFIAANDVVKQHQDMIRVIGNTVTPGPLGLYTDFNQFVTGDAPQQANDFEGVYFDDFIIGYAERGEMITAFNGTATYDGNPSADEVVEGAYQLEIRRGTEYIVDGIFQQTFDTNDRHTSAFRYVAKDGSQIFDSETFTLTDGIRSINFEFDDESATNGVTPGNLRIPYNSQMLAWEVALRVRDTINRPEVRSSLDVTAALSDGTDGSRFPDDSDDDERDDLMIDTGGDGPSGILSSFIVDLHGDVWLLGSSQTQGTIYMVAPEPVFPEIAIETGITDSSIPTSLVYIGELEIFDEDLFGFELLEDQEISIQVDTASNLDLELAILDSNQVLIEGPVQEGLTFTAPSDGQFFIRVTVNGFGSAGYGLTITTESFTTDGAQVFQFAESSDGVLNDANLLRGDSNLQRQQGQIILHGNRISYAQNYGIHIEGGDRTALDGFSPHQGSVRNMDELNNQGLVPGVTVTNNLITYSRNAGIRFSGDENPAGQPQAPVPFGRIINNTIVGVGGSLMTDIGGTDIGIQVDQFASPTILNNIVANTAQGINVDQSSDTTVVGGTLYKGNLQPTNYQSGEDFAIFLNDSDPLFVDARLGIDNYYLEPGTAENPNRAIDSSLGSLGERFDFNLVKEPLGIAPSPIIAPTRDVTGQLRVDDPTVEPPSGLGTNVFIDRGAIDRADFAGPSAVLITPADNDADNVDQNEGATVVNLASGQIASSFEIRLNDGFEPADPGEGIGVADNTVTTETVVLRRDGELLYDGIHYSFSYNTTSDTVRLTPLSGIWNPDSIYTIKLANRDHWKLASEIGANINDGDMVTVRDLSGVDADFEFERGYSISVPQTLELQLPAEAGGLGGIADGDYFTLRDGSNPPVIFEFDRDGEITSGRIAITYTVNSTLDEISDEIVAKLKGDPNDPNEPAATLALRPVNLGEGRIHIGTNVNHILDLVTAPQLTQTGVAGGVADGDYFTVDDGSKIVTFEFENDDLGDGPLVADVANGDVVINFTTENTYVELAEMISDAINLANVNLQTATLTGGIVHVGGSMSHILNADVSNVTLEGAPGVRPEFGIRIPTTAGQLSADIQDGETFTIQNGSGQPVTFEINNLDIDGSITLGNTRVDFDSGTSVNEFLQSIIIAIKGSGLNLDPTLLQGTTIVSLGASAQHTLDVTDTSLTSVGQADKAAAIPVNILPLDHFDGTQVATRLVQAINSQQAQGQLDGVVAKPTGAHQLVVTGASVVSTLDSVFLLDDWDVQTPREIREIEDLATNPLKPNQLSGETMFTIQLGIVDYDMGDAPDGNGVAPQNGYPTLSGHNPAIHMSGSSVFLGERVDRDDDGQPSDFANADDFDGDLYTFDVSSAVGISLNQSPVPAVVTQIVVDNDGANLIDGETFTIDDNGQIYTIELDNDGIFVNGNIQVSFNALSSVEDVATAITQSLVDADLRLNLSPITRLGGIVEIAGNDEDGVFGLNETGDKVSIDAISDEVFFNPYVVTELVVVASQDSLLDAWIDYNRDGDWDDPNEQIAAAMQLVTGDNTLSVRAPMEPETVAGSTFARFRVSDVGGLQPTGLTINGEIEDYEILIVDGRPPVTIDDVFVLDEGDAILVTDELSVMENDQDANGDNIRVFDFDSTSAMGAEVFVQTAGWATPGSPALSDLGWFDYLTEPIDPITLLPTPVPAIDVLKQGEQAFDTFTYSLIEDQANPNGFGFRSIDRGTVTIELTGVNDDPVVPTVPVTIQAQEDGQSVTEAFGATDVDNDAVLTYAITDVSLLGGGAVSVDNTTGEFTFDPGQAYQDIGLNDSEIFEFTYSVTDEFGAVVPGTVLVNVSGVNDTPDAFDDDGIIYTLNQDEFFDTNQAPGQLPGVLGNDQDIDRTDDSSNHAVTGINGTPLASLNFPFITDNGASFTLNTDGSFVYDPTNSTQLLALDDNESASDTIVYQMQDQWGAADEATITFTVNGLNNAPNAEDDPSGTPAYYSTLQTQVLNVDPNGVLANDFDAEGHPIVITALGAVTGSFPLEGTSLFGAEVTLEDNGSFTFDPTTSTTLQSLIRDDFEDDTFTYTISDGVLASEATVTVRVTGENKLPSALPDADPALLIDEDSVLDTSVNDPTDPADVVYSVLSNDSDPENDNLSVVGFNGTSSLTGITVNGASVELFADGTFTYDPRARQDLPEFDGTNGLTDTFTYTVSDGFGGTATAAVTIDVTGNNDDPVAVNDLFKGPRNNPLAIDVLANDEDVDSPNAELDVIPMDPHDASLGTLTFDQGTKIFTFTPDVDQHGSTIFTYRLEDQHGGVSGEASVQIVINDAPIANDDPGLNDDTIIAYVDRRTPPTPTRIDVLANDFDNDGELVPNTVAVDPADQPQHGTLSFDNGVVVYQPDVNIVSLPLTDSFVYTVQDDDGEPSLGATVTIEVIVDPYPWHNRLNGLDVNDDGFISPLDALLIISELNESGSYLLPVSDASPPPFYDVNANGYIDSADAINVINYLNDDANGEGEGEFVEPAAMDISEVTQQTLETLEAHGNNGFASDNLQTTGLSQVRSEILEELISDIADEVSGDSQDSLDDFFGQF